MLIVGNILRLLLKSSYSDQIINFVKDNIVTSYSARPALNYFQPILICPAFHFILVPTVDSPLRNLFVETFTAVSTDGWDHVRLRYAEYLFSWLNLI